MTPKTEDIIRVLDTVKKIIEVGWTQHKGARRANGSWCCPTDPEATCWCLTGAIIKALPNDENGGLTLRSYVVECLRRQMPIYDVSLGYYNDMPSHTKEDILNLISRTRSAVETQEIHKEIIWPAILTD